MPTHNRKTNTACKCGKPKCVVRTASDYALSEVSVVGRMFALLHAAGRDLSEYFEMDAEQWGAGGDVSRSRRLYFHGWYSGTIIEDPYSSTHYGEGTEIF